MLSMFTDESPSLVSSVYIAAAFGPSKTDARARTHIQPYETGDKVLQLHSIAVVQRLALLLLNLRHIRGMFLFFIWNLSTIFGVPCSRACMQYANHTGMAWPVP